MFEISMTVSSGTYVRSIIHDIGLALGSSAHVVKLTRTRQGEFALNPDPLLATPAAVPPPDVEGAPAAADVVAPVVDEAFSGGCVEWEILQSAIDDLERIKRGEEPTVVRDGDNYLPWEQELLHRCKLV